MRRSLPSSSVTKIAIAGAASPTATLHVMNVLHARCEGRDVRPIDECRECGDGGGWTWSVMRHLSLAADEVALLADGVADAATLGALVSGASATEALAPRHGRAALGAVALPAITRGADDDRAVTARAGVEPIRGGNRRPPARSGWTRRHPDATLAAGSRSRLAATPTKARVARPGPSLLPETPPR